MNKPNKEITRIARKNLNGRYRVPMEAFVLAFLISVSAEIAFSFSMGDGNGALQLTLSVIVDFLISLLSVLLNVGVLSIHMAMARNQQYNIQQMFAFFKQHPDRYIIAGFFNILITFLAILPMGIGIGIAIMQPSATVICIAVLLSILSVVLFAYTQLKLALVYYIMLDHREMGVLDAFKVSVGLMKGYTMRLLGIFISFIGWDILVLLSLGIGSLWVMPYQSQVMTVFYMDVCNEGEDGE